MPGRRQRFRLLRRSSAAHALSKLRPRESRRRPVQRMQYQVRLPSVRPPCTLRRVRTYRRHGRLPGPTRPNYRTGQLFKGSFVGRQREMGELNAALEDGTRCQQCRIHSLHRDVLRLSLRRQIIPQCLAQDFPLNSEIIPGNMRTICCAGAFHQSAEDGWDGRVSRGGTILSSVSRSEYHDGDLPPGSSLVVGVARIHRC